jgi:hypothetical protein
MMKTKQPISKKRVFFGEVISRVDSLTGVLTVRIEGLDDRIKDEDLPPCYPLNNYQFFRIYPKEGERVTVILEREYETLDAANQEFRFWNSLFISSPFDVSREGFYKRPFLGEISPDIRIKNDPLFRGLFESDDTLVIRGRDNTDISFKEEEIMLRAGRHAPSAPHVFNDIDQSYIRISAKKNKNDIPAPKLPDEKEVVKYYFYLDVIDKNVLLKVVDERDDSIVATFSKQFDNEAALFSETVRSLTTFQSLFTPWILITDSQFFDDFPKKSPNLPAGVQNTEGGAYNKKTSIDIVASQINLLSHKSPYLLITQDGEIPAQERKNIEETAQRMVMGDNLLAFLDLLRLFVNNHVHPYPGRSPSRDEIVRRINDFDLEGILNNDIRLA